MKHGTVYAAGSARRHWRRVKAARSTWWAIAWGLLVVGVAATGVGLAVLYISVEHVYLGVALAAAGVALVAAGLWAWLHADDVPQPPAQHRPDRQHLDDALTVWVERRKPGRRR